MLNVVMLSVWRRFNCSASIQKTTYHHYFERHDTQHKDSQGTLTKGERLSTLDLLVQTSFDQVILMLKMLFTFFTKQAILIRGSTVLSLPLQ